MTEKSIILSSSGLKNLNPKINPENNFNFIFGDHQITINNISAEFISPAVSRLHYADPTIDTIYFENKLNGITFTEDVLSLIKLISNGYSISINEEQSIQLKIISIFLENEELLSALNKLFADDINETNIDHYLTNINLLYQTSYSQSIFNYTNIINFISSHFYLIDETKLIQLPISILYSIISNENLTIKSEDSLFDFIEKYFNQNGEEKESDLNIFSFYEEIEFTELSENKLNKFIQFISPSEISNKLWQKLNKFFFIKRTDDHLNKNRYLYQGRQLEFDVNNRKKFEGIIDHLTKDCGGNVSDKGVVKVTSSSSCGASYGPKNIVDIHDKNHYFESANFANSWLKYDFVDRKVHPTHYSLRSRHEGGRGCNHLMSWVIEGSNSDNDSDWKILDTRQNVTCLDDKNASHTFDIQENLSPDESYRFLRIRQTGRDSRGYYHLILSALEFFGTLIE